MRIAFVGIFFASALAVAVMASIVWSSFDNRHEVVVQQNILATKTAEARDHPITNPRYELENTDQDGIHPDDSADTPDSR